MPGALAVHAVHAARERGWFAGGVLFIDLHGYDNAPVEPGQALDALLRALGVAGEPRWPSCTTHTSVPWPRQIRLPPRIRQPRNRPPRPRQPR